ncbi:MAG: putative electron transfer oxidoreductase [Lacunisphaera sp.]|nr:putative electron transfer oxidoreductase [Lacunisphaera sp.]
MNPTRPIEIVGGGLAGLSLGLALRRAGVPVTLCEAGVYPRHRVCGEFITGLSVATIAGLGLGPFLNDALRHREIAWFHDGHLARRQRLPSPAIALSRHRLDARIARAFADAGGQLLTNHRSTALDPVPGRVFTTGRRRAQSGWLGLKIHARNLPLLCDLELHLGAETYIGLSRVEDGRVNLCGLFRRREISAKGSELLLAYLHAANLSGLAARLAGADFDEASFSAVAAVDFDQHVPETDRVSLGDACAMIPPFTGNGMAMAFQSAETALEPLLAYAAGTTEWPETCHTIQSALQQRFRLRLAAADLLHPFLLQPPRQRWLARLARAHCLPLQPLYSVLH